MESLTCSKCKKKCATTETEAASLFGFCDYTKRWYKNCIECREKKCADNPEIIWCRKCGKQALKIEATNIFGIIERTGTFHKRCITCREKYREYYKSKPKSNTYKPRKCEHNIFKNSCTICTPECTHGHHRNSCAICAPRCEHGKFKRVCLICKPYLKEKLTCEHGIFRYGCKLCNLCEHNAHKKRCKLCIVNEYLKQNGAHENINK